MRNLIVLAVIAIALFSCSQQGIDPQIEKRIAAVENGLVEFMGPKAVFEPDSNADRGLLALEDRMQHYKVPGLCVAVVNDNELEWVKPYGIIKAGSEDPVTAETYFQAASTSKLVTAAIALHFVEKGMLDLDKDVNGYLKSWKVPENEFTRDQKVTLRLLLAHQAGLPATNFAQEDGAGDPTLAQVLSAEPPALNRPAVVEYVPGTEWRYSNIGFVVVQLLLEDVAGKSFERIARETVFEPLGMKRSTFVYPLKTGREAVEAMPHDADGVLHQPSLPPTAVAHGGLMTTPGDLALFAAELMRSYSGMSSVLLSEEMTRQMLSRAVDLDPLMFGVQLGAGLGVLLHGEGEEFKFAHPGSNLPGANCWLIGWPEKGLGAVIMTNGASGEVLALEIISAVAGEYGKSIE